LAFPFHFTKLLPQPLHLILRCYCLLLRRSYTSEALTPLLLQRALHRGT
jgi:hypothetical protein